LTAAPTGVVPAPGVPAAAHRHVLVLEPGRADRRYWLDLWTYRELFAILAWRDVTVRYKQTVIGIAWAALRPFLTMVIMTVVFHVVAKVQPPPGAPYAILVFAGLLPWTLFSTILSEASGSLVTNANLVGKVYFPRVIIPASTALVALVDFVVALAILACMMVYYQYMPSWRLLLLPAFVVLAVLASLGPALFVTALNVKYRDFRYIIPFIIQFGLYLAPVGYASSVVPAQWRFWYSLNPVVGVIDGFRWCVLGGSSPLYWPGFIGSLGVVALFLVVGVAYFRRTERTFADLI
jgi:lipopolysaccharide transport system permease protein